MLALLLLCFAGWKFYPESLDHSLFRHLNGWLVGKPAAQKLMAFANTRKFDSLAGLVLAAFFLAFLPIRARGRGLLWSAPLSVLAVFALAWHDPWA